MSNDLHEKIGRIDERTKLTLDALARLEDTLNDNNEKLSSRITILEAFKSKTSGILVALGCVSGFIGASLHAVIEFVKRII